MSVPFVVISVVNWNTAALTLRCLDALHALDYPNYRVVVVDNASHDDSVARLRERYPDIELVRSDANLGYGGGHELALRYAQDCGAAAIWLVNSDAQVEADALRRLVDAWRAHGDAIYGAAPLRDDGDRVILNFPDKYLDPRGTPRPFRRDRTIVFDDAWRTRAPLRVGAAAGSGFFVPLAVAHAHGWFDPAWFLYCEEIDYCYRLRARGVASWLVPQARIRHDGGGSHRAWPHVAARIAYYRARNEIVLAQRHASGVVAWTTAAKKLARGVLTLLRDPTRGALVLRGARDAIAGRLGKTLAPEDGYAAEHRASGQGAVFVERALRKMRTAWRRVVARAPACRIEAVGRARIAFNPEHVPFVREYYRHCIALFRDALVAHDAAINLVFGDYAVDFGNANPTRRIDLQWEHTLVKPGGRDSDDALSGAVPLPDGSGTYLARLANRAYLDTCDAIVEYSRPNLENLTRAGGFDAYLAKTALVAPLLYAPDFDTARPRSREVVTLFADTTQPRRRAFLDACATAALPLRNVRGVYDGERLRALYRDTRILVNVHQTPHHDTFEELRILPALLSGVLVVSEDVPLRERVPYHEFVIWASYGDLVATVRDVVADYDAYRRRIFGDSRLAGIFDRMARENRDVVADVVRRLAAE